MLYLHGSIIFELVDRHGLPLEFIMTKCEEENIVIDFYNFCHIAIKKNWNKHKLFIRIKEACRDVYDKNKAEQIIKRLNILYENM